MIATSSSQSNEEEYLPLLGPNIDDHDRGGGHEHRSNTPGDIAWRSQIHDPAAVGAGGAHGHVAGNQ